MTTAHANTKLQIEHRCCSTQHTLSGTPEINNGSLLDLKDTTSTTCPPPKACAFDGFLDMNWNVSCFFAFIFPFADFSNVYTKFVYFSLLLTPERRCLRNDPIWHAALRNAPEHTFRLLFYSHFTSNSPSCRLILLQEILWNSNIFQVKPCNGWIHHSYGDRVGATDKPASGDELFSHH